MPREHGGLWLPGMERDACGIGFVASARDEVSHRIVRKGIEAVCCLTHRGAVASDAKTGDGAGIMTQIPADLLRAGLSKGSAKLLRRSRDLAVAMVFLPQDAPSRHRAVEICEEVIAKGDLIFLEWRRVPVDPDALGDKARERCPIVRQALLARDESMSDGAFERACYLLRKQIEKQAAAEGIEGFYIPSFSARTIVYKGLLVAPQLDKFYLDLADPRFASAFALYHQRYSTNTYPTWFLAQPFRFLAHNGEINTLQGNANWLRAAEGAEDAHIWNSHESIQALRPLIQPGNSDSSALDNALESFVLGGRDLLHTVLMMQPQAWANDPEISDEVRAFYEYHSCLQEPWDGPAALSFTDGRIIGASLDRNGLRPARYQISDDGLLVVGSEVGVVDLEGAKVLEKGRLGPGQILALDTATGEIMRNADIKERYAKAQPYRQWVSQNLIHGDKETAQVLAPSATQVLANGHTNGHGNGNGHGDPLIEQLKAFGYTSENVEDILLPMAQTGSEATGSMGDDTPLSVLSEKPRSLYNYFRQRFAQVTNPPIDPLREKLVMSLSTLIGPRANLWSESPESCRRITFSSPLLSESQLEWLRDGASTSDARFASATIKATFPVEDGEEALERAVGWLRQEAERAVRGGASILILSDRGVDEKNAPIPALLAVGAVHHHLTRAGLRNRCSIIAESGEPHDPHAFACLLGFGAAAVNPYLAHAAIRSLCEKGQVEGFDGDVSQVLARFKKAIESGLLKVMSKMGISTLSSYQGAQIFEALGLAPQIVEECFTHTPSRIRGSGYKEVARDVLRLHGAAFPDATKLDNFAFLRYRKDGEAHAFSPTWFKTFHNAVRNGDYETQYAIYRDQVNERERPIALRDLLDWAPAGSPIPIEEVEPVEAIFARVTTGAMSLGALSTEAHECLAIAMNRIGGRSNSGEGGEDPDRFSRDDNGDWRNSAIKQVASARFGVTPEYLASAKELQIKMAQGAKPGEGGQLPGFKVSDEIARVRHAVPGVTLISPPPHHDIYSIEDLAQLIYDLKHVNPRARVSVKLVAQSGVGTVAAGVAKAYADTIVISGHDGGTGASPVASIKNTGVSWELGLAEAQQVLIENGLRGRVKLHADGGFKTGRDIIVAALLGADEYGFGTSALVAAGCVMARQCHLNTCPVGVATQREDLRAKFPGKPEHVVNFFTFVAQEVREHLAEIGVRRLDQIIGRADLLRLRDNARYPKTANVDLSPLFYQFEEHPNNPHRALEGRNDRPADQPIDDVILQDARDAITHGRPLTLQYVLRNTDRTVGGRIAGEIAYAHGDQGLAEDTLTLQFRGTAGQSFGAFNIAGMRLELEGEACDYVGKMMHGGTIVIKPHADEEFPWHENVIIGNTVFYGATGGFLFAAGTAGERFGVRNSGGVAVVEGVGDHGCEYMTRGTVVVLGETGLNFGAGMSGGLAFVYDASKTLEKRFNPDMVGLHRVETEEHKTQLKELVERHARETGSPHAQRLLGNWDAEIAQFWAVIPKPEKAPAPKLERQRPDRPDRPGGRPVRPSGPRTSPDGAQADGDANGNGRTSPDGGVKNADPDAPAEEKGLEDLTTRKPDASSTTLSAEQQILAPEDEKGPTAAPVPQN
jgi:glutamate synthase (NADPH/NADH) large chain/glutamate synthase (ferredoxin)